MSDAAHNYLVALGSNVPHHLHGRPEQVLTAAIDQIDGEIGDVTARSRVIDSAPLGPSRRRYANAAILLRTDRNPPDLLYSLKAIETKFGRKPGGARWARRVLDLDIVLWSGGMWSDDDVTVPHPLFRQRNFVLGPAAEIAPMMRDPVTGRTVRQILTRFLWRHPRQDA